MKTDGPPPATRQAGCLGDKLVHRALGEARPRSAQPVLSVEARDRLYARMFPSHVCLGAAPLRAGR